MDDPKLVEFKKLKGLRNNRHMDEPEFDEKVMELFAVNENTSDGYHTFKELYDHRIALFIALMRAYPHLSWCSRKQSDGTTMEGWFIAGMNLPNGQISYHLPDEAWYKFGPEINTLEQAPEWDGHTSADVVKRIEEWSGQL